MGAGWGISSTNISCLGFTDLMYVIMQIVLGNEKNCQYFMGIVLHPVLPEPSHMEVIQQVLQDKDWSKRTTQMISTWFQRF